MANLKEIRTRISSVSSTRQITSAMKMVSAAKLKKAQDAITQMRPYSNKLSEILINISGGIDVANNPYAEQREVKRVLIVLVSSNRGLCGAFNSNVAKDALQLAQDHFAPQLAAGNVSFITIGKKAGDLVKHKGLQIETDYNHALDSLAFDEISEIAVQLMKDFVSGDYDKIYVVYNEFVSASTQVLRTEQFLPILPPSNANEHELDYIFEPSMEYIAKELIPRSLKTQLFKAVLDSNASEHGARMIAMHKATDNATDMIRDLRLTYNKARQAAITTEILEVVGGADALTN